MREKDHYTFSIADQPVYPHIKLTNEEFPRLLATRRFRKNDGEVFGAFLNRTSVRILIDFLNRTFRLRSCDIRIDGSFPVPCTQYYEKRCVAPCVSSLCTAEEHLEIADSVRLFLQNEKELFRAAAARKMDKAVEDLKFERAARWRDILHHVEAFWANPRQQVWLDDTVDTYDIEHLERELLVHLVSQRRRRTLGSKTWAFPMPKDAMPEIALHDIIRQFYRYHIPREVRVPVDFPGRTALARELSRSFGRKIEIKVVKLSARILTAERALSRARDENYLRELAPAKPLPEVLNSLKNIFGLKRKPRRIEAYDVAHISATAFVAAVSVWIAGEYSVEDYSHWPSDRVSELGTLRAFIEFRMREGSELPDLVLIDGGAAQLQAALKAVEGLTARKFKFIAAVKPRNEHSGVSHFLLENGERIEFDSSVPEFRILKILRDEAHDLANAAHRQKRDMRHFYELAAIFPSISEKERRELLQRFGSARKLTEIGEDEIFRLLEPASAKLAIKDRERYLSGDSPAVEPLVVPLRFVENGGDAEDLRPIITR